MALTFPSNPSNGQQYTFNGILHKYVSAKNAWIVESGTSTVDTSGLPHTTATTVISAGHSGVAPSYTTTADGWYRVYVRNRHYSSSGSNDTITFGFTTSQTIYCLFGQGGNLGTTGGSAQAFDYSNLFVPSRGSTFRKTDNYPQNSSINTMTADVYGWIPAGTTINFSSNQSTYQTTNGYGTDAMWMTVVRYT